VGAEAEEGGWQDLEDGDEEKRWGEEDVPQEPAELRPQAPPLDLDLPLLPAPAPTDKVRDGGIQPTLSFSCLVPALLPGVSEEASLPALLPGAKGGCCFCVVRHVQMKLVLASNVLGIESKEFDPESYEDKDANLVQNIARWRRVQGPDGSTTVGLPGPCGSQGTLVARRCSPCAPPPPFGISSRLRGPVADIVVA